jgi:long-subunit fatty acid transport protein
MIRNKVFYFLLLLSAVAIRSEGQTATLSPYSRFGPGELLFNGYAHQQAMGGSSIADFSVSRLNFTNPATYAYDTLMILEFGLNAELSRIEQSNQSSTRENASLSYLSFGMPLKRDRWGLSFGIIPFSATGYDLQSSRTLDSNGTYNLIFEGDGGYNRFFLGSGVKIGKHLSAGFNASYLFGTVSKTSRIEFNSIEFFDTRYKEELRLSDLYYEFGLHWQQELKNNYRLAIGLTGSPAVEVSSKSTVEWVNYNTGSSGIESVRDTVLSIKDQKGTVTMPQYFGIGLGLSKGDKWTILADATMQDWSTYSGCERSELF